MGHVIFPGALYKFFLTASVDARIKRRQIQLKQQGNYASLSAVKNTIVQRDESDRNRMMVMPDVCVIDTTCLSIAQVMAIIDQRLSAIGLYFH
jgi:cytidylate kinase